MAAPALILDCLPSEFSADPAHSPNVFTLLNALWAHRETVIVNNEGEFIIRNQARLTSGRLIEMPRHLPDDDTVSALVDYLQLLLDCNRLDLVVYLHHEANQFTISTTEAFLQRLTYPLTEYRVEVSSVDAGLYHPNIAYTWMWVSYSLKNHFAEGCPERCFPASSRYCRTAFGYDLEDASESSPQSSL